MCEKPVQCQGNDNAQKDISRHFTPPNMMKTPRQGSQPWVGVIVYRNCPYIRLNCCHGWLITPCVLFSRLRLRVKLCLASQLDEVWRPGFEPGYTRFILPRYALLGFEGFPGLPASSRISITCVTTSRRTSTIGICVCTSVSHHAAANKTSAWRSAA